MIQNYARSCAQWLSRLWAFDRKHQHTKETA